MNQARGPSSGSTVTSEALDAVIVGGGIAGLWLLNLLSARGYRVVLLEAEALGCGQTLVSQGMIHGGLKYALAGRLTDASEAIARMPERWRRCLDGRGEVDLSGLAPLSERYFMFADASTPGRLATFFASRALRGRIRRLTRAEFPPPLAAAAADAVVYELNDFVLDTAALLERLRAPVAGRIYQHRLDPAEVSLGADVATLTLNGLQLCCRRLLIAAGAGTGPLLQGLGLNAPAMQLRPLQQVLVRAPALPQLYAHCLTGLRRPEPRLTITSHRDGSGWLWYLGGQLASDGVAMGEAELVAHARSELARCVPWLPWREANLSTLRSDRAEPARASGRRPDEAFVAAQGACVVAWPTKLTLTPDLGDKVLALLEPARSGQAEPATLPLPRAALGRTPW
ncbi:MAG: FAD-dependent oxidoreductase [Pseudomonadales bacterium]